MLLYQDQLFKTQKFANPVYIGDPINAVRIYNEKEVDEILILDISASRKNLLPNFKLIEKLAGECQMPFSYGGGIRTVEVGEKIVSLGVEKIAIGQALLSHTSLVRDLSDSIGAQSLSAILNLRRSNMDNNIELFDYVKNNSIKFSIEEFVNNLVISGIGEIVFNFVDRDGTGEGFDLEFLSSVGKLAYTQMTVLGGAGSFEDLIMASEVAGFKIGLAAGSLFVFKGKFRSVMPSYVSSDLRQRLDNRN